MSKEIVVLELIDKAKREEFLKKVNSIPPGKSIALITHDFPDPDGLAGAMALQRYFSERHIGADIFAAGGVSHPQNSTIVNKLRIVVKDENFFAAHKEDYALMIFCDTGEDHTSIKVHPDIVIDHHSRDKIEKDSLIIREETGAVCAIVYLLLKSVGAELSKDAVVALLLGINIDTNYLRGATNIDEGVHDELISRLDSKDWKEFVYLCFRYDITRPCVKLMGRACSSVEYDDCLAVVGLGDTSSGSENYYGSIAEYILREPAIRLVVIIGIRDGQYIKVSIRTDLETIDIEQFCKMVFEVGTTVDMGRATGGFRNNMSGGALIPLSNREREEWAAATTEEREILFGVKMRRYKERIKKFLDT